MGVKRALCLNRKDNVATALESILPGDTINVEVKGASSADTVDSLESIPFGFKVALSDISKGDIVMKYGEPMGRASADIKKGAQVHVHNVEGVRV